MTIFEMLGQSGVLTLLGMGVVFGFLVILVICVSIMGKIISALGLDKSAGAPAVSGAASPQVSAPSSSAAKSTAVTAAIVAAVTEYQKDND